MTIHIGTWQVISKIRQSALSKLAIFSLPIAAILFAFLFQPTIEPVNATEDLPTFNLVGTHPDAVAQSSAQGKILVGLQPFNNKLYIGYGDTFKNTGPIAITPYDPATNTFTNEWTLGTEAIWQYRIIGQKLYAPADDRKGADFARFDPPWTSVTNLYTSHAFDMATLNGSDRWLVGSKDTQAVAWRSTNGEASWGKPLRLDPQVSGDIARFYFVGIYQSRLYVQGYDYYADLPHSTSKTFKSGVWSDGPNLLPTGGHGWKPTVFASKMVYQTRIPNYAQSQLLAFDGTQVTQPFSGGDIWDFSVGNGAIWVLAADGTVYRSSDLVSWTAVATAPTTARSIAWFNNYLYIGTTDAELYQSSVSIQ